MWLQSVHTDIFVFRRSILCILVSLVQPLQKCTSTSFAIYLSVNLCISFLHHCDGMMFLQEDGRSCTNICSLPKLFLQRLKRIDLSKNPRAVDQKTDPEVPRLGKNLPCLAGAHGILPISPSRCCQRQHLEEGCLEILEACAPDWAIFSERDRGRSRWGYVAALRSKWFLKHWWWFGE